MNYKFSRPCNTLKSAQSSSHAIVRWPLIPCGRQNRSGVFTCDVTSVNVTKVPIITARVTGQEGTRIDRFVPYPTDLPTKTLTIRYHVCKILQLKYVLLAVELKKCYIYLACSSIKHVFGSFYFIFHIFFSYIHIYMLTYISGNLMLNSTS